MAASISNSNNSPRTFTSGSVSTPFQHIYIDDPLSLSRGITGGGNGGTVTVTLHADKGPLGTISDPGLPAWGTTVDYNAGYNSSTFRRQTAGGPHPGGSNAYPNQVLDRLIYTAPMMADGVTQTVYASVGYIGTTFLLPTDTTPTKVATILADPLVFTVAGAALPDVVKPPVVIVPTPEPVAPPVIARPTVPAEPVVVTPPARAPTVPAEPTPTATAAPVVTAPPSPTPALPAAPVVAQPSPALPAVPAAPVVVTPATPAPTPTVPAEPVVTAPPSPTPALPSESVVAQPKPTPPAVLSEPVGVAQPAPVEPAEPVVVAPATVPAEPVVAQPTVPVTPPAVPSEPAAAAQPGPALPAEPATVTPVPPVTPPVAAAVPVTPAAPVNFGVVNITTGTIAGMTGVDYAGSQGVKHLLFLAPTTESLAVASYVPDVFIKTGSGNDAVNTWGGSGTNVLDGGEGSNFLVGGTGKDTFFVDARNAAGPTWSTVRNLQAGDAATLWGITAEEFGLSWVDGQGAADAKGLTLHATAAGKQTASLTLSGYGVNDLSNGRLALNFGQADAGSYLYVAAV